MKDATKIVTGGRLPGPDPRFVNPPVYHASTVLFDGLSGMEETAGTKPGDGVTYAVHGTPGTYALEAALTALEGGHRTRLCSSGAQALSGPLLSHLSAGDHALIPDSCYGNTRELAIGMLRRFGIDCEFYEPLLGGEIRTLIRPDTKVVFTESPGSQTFEVQDIPAIAEEAHKAGAIVMMDNTWASPLYCKPLALGADISIQALTKYVGGHGDLVMGAVTTTEAAYPALRRGWYNLGLSPSPDDTHLVMRGLRSLHARMPLHWANGIALGEWLKGQAEVADVVHPAMEHDPSHALWRRDFTGAGGLFGFWLADGLGTPGRLRAMFDGMRLFGIGYSWGSFQSMMMPVAPRRTATPFPRPGQPGGQLIRIHAGLEDIDDLKDDLADAFARLTAD